MVGVCGRWCAEAASVGSALREASVDGESEGRH